MHTYGCCSLQNIPERATWLMSANIVMQECPLMLSASGSSAPPFTDTRAPHGVLSTAGTCSFAKCTARCFGGLAGEPCGAASKGPRHGL